ncbi:polyketide synthase [Novosphingobium resinovorum]
MFGSGVAVVALRRLEDAMAADHIHAVIRGSAINNDGAGKVGYLAPSVDGQAAVIAEALAVSGIAPSAIDYVEAHGTGTPIGDPIEVAALRQVFAQSGARPEPCALGSVKANIGHTDTAAGAAGVIKVALAMRHAELPLFRISGPQIPNARWILAFSAYRPPARPGSGATIAPVAPGSAHSAWEAPMPTSSWRKRRRARQRAEPPSPAADDLGRHARCGGCQCCGAVRVFWGAAFCGNPSVIASEAKQSRAVDAASGLPRPFGARNDEAGRRAVSSPMRPSPSTPAVARWHGAGSP